ncbi:hypothetical protein BHF69_09845 [Anaerostipes sp. 992a]|uniref:C40 family peptidase n=1 Tax=Anaerostipes sp. 992a TaxID=1261637 RepID=UPI0009512608|nr:C40 family peptidase [Anaerostipes sp. 992a]OLR62956.1 hypothetical protein BHF69_09845 [Anaerostipes sp. 992a]
MNRKLAVRILSFILCFLMTAGVLVFSNEKEASAAYTRYTTASVKVKAKADKNSTTLTKFSKGKKLTCYTLVDNYWYKIKYNGEYAYVAKKYTTKKKPVTGTDVANYAKRFVGNPYVYGGSSLTKGTDCSGFTMSVYKHFGYSLPHSSSGQASKGTKVSWSNKKPGDLICYYGHVAIYIGNNKIVHASNEKTGIKISNNAGYRKVRCVRRIIK